MADLCCCRGGCRCNLRNVFDVVLREGLPWLKDGAAARLLLGQPEVRVLFSDAQQACLKRVVEFFEAREVRWPSPCLAVHVAGVCE